MTRDVEAFAKLRAPIEWVRDLLATPGVANTDGVAPEERRARSVHSTLAVEVGGAHHNVVIDLRAPQRYEHSVTLPVCWHATGQQRCVPHVRGRAGGEG